jgi:tetratricopeptide (TPR) repeat protein
MKLYSLLVLFLFSCATVVKIPVVETMPPDFLTIMKGGRNVAIYVDVESSDAGRESDPKATIFGAVETALTEYRYFRLVDVKSKPERLKEVALSQMLGDVKGIIEELSLDGVLYLDVPQPPGGECKSGIDRIKKTRCTKTNKEGKCLQYQEYYVNLYVKTLSYTVFVRAKLVNVFTGRSIIFTNVEPAILKNSSEVHASCPSETEGYSKALKIAANNIVKNVSPRMIDYKIPLLTSTDGVTISENKSAVKSYLKSGVEWASADPPDYEAAKKDWEKALSLSDRTSTDAHWNLAVYYWFSGDIEKANEFFEKAVDIGGPDWLSSKNRNIFTKFKQERERFKMEKGM